MLHLPLDSMGITLQQHTKFTYWNFTQLDADDSSLCPVLAARCSLYVDAITNSSGGTTVVMMTSCLDVRRMSQSLPFIPNRRLWLMTVCWVMTCLVYAALFFLLPSLLQNFGNLLKNQQEATENVISSHGAQGKSWLFGKYFQAGHTAGCDRQQPGCAGGVWLLL